MACFNNLTPEFLNFLAYSLERACGGPDAIQLHPTIKGIVVSCHTINGVCNLTVDNGKVQIPYKIAAEGIIIEPGTLIEISFADGNAIISQIGV